MPDKTYNPQESPYRYVIAALALTSFVMSFISRFSWPPMAPMVASVMGINVTEAMAYMSMFYIGYVVTQIPGGILGDSFGPRRVLAVSMFIQGLGTLALGLTASYRMGLMLRLLCGLGAGCVYSSCLKSAVAWFSPAQRGLAIGIIMTAPTLGVALPNIIMPLLNESMGWQGAFRAVGLVILAFSAVTFLMMKEIKGGQAGPRKGILAGLKYVISSRNILLIAFTGFSMLWCQMGFSSIANTYMKEALGFTPVQAGRVMSLYGLIGIVMGVLAGYMCGKFPTGKKWMIIAAHALIIIFLMLFGRLTGLSGIMAVAAVLGCLMAFANPIYSVLIAENAGQEWAATAGGLGNAIFQTGAIISPLAIGLARDATGDFSYTWLILAAGAALGIITTLGVTPKPAE